MEFFRELLAFSETMESFDNHINHGQIPSQCSPDSGTIGEHCDLGEFLQSFPVPATPPGLFPFYDLDVGLFTNSETFSPPCIESRLAISNIHEEPYSTNSPHGLISNKGKAIQIPVPFPIDTAPTSSDDTQSLLGWDFSDNQHHPPSKKRKTEPLHVLAGLAPLGELDTISFSVSESSVSGDSSTSGTSGEQHIMESMLLKVSASFEETGSLSSKEHQGLLLIHLLIALAEAISNGSRDLAEVILFRVRKLVNSSGSNIERIGFYFYHGLQWLFTGINELDVKPHLIVPYKEFLLPYRVLIEIYPCSRFAQFTANQSILDAIPKDSKKLHIMDFDIIDGLQWPPLMAALVSEGYNIKHIRLTSIKWTNSPENSSVRTFNRLREFAEELGLDFSSEEVELEDLANCLREDEEEVSVANCMFKLLHMIERSTWQVAKFIEASKKFYPRVFTLSYCNLSGDDGSTDLVSTLASCLQWASAICDSLESALPTQKLARQAVESLFIGPRFCRELMLENDENNVQHVPKNLGLVRGRMSPQNLEQGRDLLRLHAREDQFYRLDAVNPSEILLRWGETCLVSSSVWHLL